MNTPRPHGEKEPIATQDVYLHPERKAALIGIGKKGCPKFYHKVLIPPFVERQSKTIGGPVMGKVTKADPETDMCLMQYELDGEMHGHWVSVNDVTPALRLYVSSTVDSDSAVEEEISRYNQKMLAGIPAYVTAAHDVFIDGSR